MIVIGTAGHIDHGKSAVVKRLTGTDPDRLPEEQARGMTIDLGFAFYRAPGGSDIAFVDVPGHERFVKNMIAGAGGIDVAMLVVAADDGWMPQSQEHFQVVRLLGIEHGLIVINKIDLVDRDWLELLQEEIREKVRGSFLAGAPCFLVSAETGTGFDALQSYLDNLHRSVRSSRDIGKARLYIDRVFVRPGIGGVVTGTLRGGTLSVGQTVSVWPAGATAKIRSLQSQNRDVESAEPGQRTAASLTGVDKERLVRGGVVSARTDLSYFSEYPVLALAVELLPEARVALANRRRLLLLVGTTEMEGEVRLFNRKEIAPGESGMFFFRPDSPIYCLVGDRFIIRLPTPMVTLGGGRVLDHLPRMPRRKDLPGMSYLDRRISDDPDDLVASELKKRVIASPATLLRDADLALEEIEESVQRLIAEQVAGTFRGFIYDTAAMGEACDTLLHEITAHLKDRSHLPGLSSAELQRCSPFGADTTRVLTEYLMATKRLDRVGELVTVAGHGRELTGQVKKAHDEIMSRLTAEPYAPPLLSELAAGGKNHRDAIKYLLDSGEGYKCGTSFVFLSDIWKEIVRYIKHKLTEADSLAVGELREQFGFTRKFAIPILEETDRIKLTHRDGDIRVKGERFEDPEFDL